LVLVLFTTLATSATGTSTKPTSSPTAGTSITVKPTTTVITANSTTSKAHATVGRRKRDVDNGTLCLFPVYLVLY
jgi:hypothetical protein